MLMFVLVVWFGIADQQSSFAVPGIASQAECERLGAVMSKGKPWPQPRCYPYRGVR